LKNENISKNNFSRFEVQNSILDISNKCPNSRNAVPVCENPKKPLVSIMLSFSKIDKNICDANFFVYFGLVYLIV
jgi:hypothetical protein